MTSSPGAGEVFPQRESRVLKLVAKVLGSIRKFPAVLLPLPLGEVDLRSKDGEGARRLPRYESIRCNGKLSGIAKRRPLGGAGERSETEGVKKHPRRHEPAGVLLC